MTLGSIDFDTDHRLHAVPRGHDRRIELEQPRHKPTKRAVSLAWYILLGFQPIGVALLSTKKLLLQVLDPGTWRGGGGKG